MSRCLLSITCSAGRKSRWYLLSITRSRSALVCSSQFAHQSQRTLPLCAILQTRKAHGEGKQTLVETQPFQISVNMEDTNQSQKKEDQKESEHINLKVTGQDGSVVHFKIKKNTPLRKLMGAYCNRAGIQTGVVRFRFDGNPINDEDTPAMLEMEDGDSIDVFQQQTGGFCL